MIGGTAAMCATVFSNPFDVIKTRQQLFGELQKQKINNLNERNPYKGVFRSAKTIIKADGILGLQKGLGSALCFQFVLNSSRLGIYETGESFGITKNKNGENSPIYCVLWGGFSGIVGAALGCPLLMIKTQMQSKSHGKFAVGDQHQHKGTIPALISIYKESGIKGLWRGYTASVPRTALMSSIQLSVFTKSKDYLRNYEVFRNSTVLISVGSGMISGLVACCTMSPLDVITTRLFNQGLSLGLMFVVFN